MKSLKIVFTFALLKVVRHGGLEQYTSVNLNNINPYKTEASRATTASLLRVFLLSILYKTRLHIMKCNTVGNTIGLLTQPLQGNSAYTRSEATHSPVRTETIYCDRPDGSWNEKGFKSFFTLYNTLFLIKERGTIGGKETLFFTSLFQFPPLVRLVLPLIEFNTK